MSGAGTNAGIDFQQRVAALYFAAMLSGRSLIPGLSESVEVTSIAFETADPVDDFRVELSDGTKIYFQAKRALSFSSLPTSDLYGALQQCVRQFLKNPDNPCMLALAVSPDTSARVRDVLPELLDRYRQHQDGPDISVLNQIQKETIDQFHALISALLLVDDQAQWSPAVSASFARTLYVFTFDIDADRPSEIVAKLLLEPLSKYPSSLLWTKLISVALDAAKKRRRFDLTGLRAELKVFLRSESTAAQTSSPDSIQKWTATFINEAPPSVLNDVLLIDAIPSDPTMPLTLLQVARFDATGKSCIRYKDGMFVADRNSGTVLLRAATWSGMARLLEVPPAAVIAKGVTIIEQDEDGQSDFAFTAEHQARLASLLESGAKELACLRCGRFVLQKEALAIEVDEDGQVHRAGVVHDRCHRPCDRVLGVLKNEQALTLPSDFDIPAWIRLIKNGQGGLGSIKQAQALGHRLVKISWNPENEQEWNKSWCVEIELASGHRHYATARGRLIRLSQREAVRKSAELQTQSEDMQSHGKTFCMTTVSGQIGWFEQPISWDKIKDKDEDVSAVRLVRAVLVTGDISQRYASRERFYTPLVYLVNPQTEDFIDLAGVRLFLTDPMQVPNSVDRWRVMGLFEGEYSARIIGSDAEFDRMVTNALAEGRRVVIDPEFDERWLVCGGGEVENIKTMIHNSKRPSLALEARSLGRKIGRNDPCPCGSGKKFKRCCWLSAD